MKYKEISTCTTYIMLESVTRGEHHENCNQNSGPPIAAREPFFAYRLLQPPHYTHTEYQPPEPYLPPRQLDISTFPIYKFIRFLSYFGGRANPPTPIPPPSNKNSLILQYQLPNTLRNQQPTPTRVPGRPHQKPATSSNSLN